MSVPCAFLYSQFEFQLDEGHTDRQSDIWTSRAASSQLKIPKMIFDMQLISIKSCSSLSDKVEIFLKVLLLEGWCKYIMKQALRKFSEAA